MKLYLFVFFWALIQRFATAVVEYKLESPLYLAEARLKILHFHILPNWIDFTLEYNQSSVATASWFAIGFGHQVMKCSYALTFEPQVDSTNSIKDIMITERRLGEHEPGLKLSRRLAFVETDINVNPEVIIRTRIIRQRIVPVNYLLAQNVTQACPDNPYGYYQFLFDGSDIDIIFARGVDGAYNVSYHTAPNHGTGSISFTAVEALNALNSTGLVNVTSFSTLMDVTCPPRNSFNDSFAARFDWPFVPRVCGDCANNESDFNVTLLPMTTGIEGGINTFGSSDLFNTTQEYECTIMNNDTSNPVCGCTSVQWNNTSILFLVDGAGYQNDSDWRQFTWKILEGFLTNVMGNTNLNIMDVNVIIYGGSSIRRLVPNRLTFEFLQSIQNDPVPANERYQSNLCNATNFATQYLKSALGTTKILITIPWQSPSDELDCLVCDNCTLAGINSFTAKILGEVDLSVLEMTFGGYDDCSYLYNTHGELRLNQLEDWPYILAAISDFICFASENPISAANNFLMSLLMTSFLDGPTIANHEKNITDLIEGAFEIFSNFTLEANREFDVQILTIADTDQFPAPSNAEKNRVLINSTVSPKDTEVFALLNSIARTPEFNAYVNRSFYQYFAGADASALVYSVNNVVLNNSDFNETITSTGIQTTGIQTTGIIQTTQFISTLPTETIIPTLLNMSTTFFVSEEVVGMWEQIRNFFRNLKAWHIVVMVAGGILLCLLLACLCGLCARMCKKRENNNYAYANANNTEYEQENVPVMISSNAQSHYVTAQTTTTQQQSNQYNKTYADDDQVYV